MALLTNGGIRQADVVLAEPARALVVEGAGAARRDLALEDVRARFTLDAMPGKQMSIDAELRAGHIDHNEARRRRTALARESQLFGSMDGAMKFVIVPRLAIDAR